MADASLSILVVDPDANLRSSLAADLKQHGHRIMLASSGSRATEFLARMGFDLIIADAEMPQGSGLELRRKESPIPLILTSSREGDEAPPWKELGAAGFLQKPFTPQEAIAAIRKLPPVAAASGFAYFLNIRRSLVVATWSGKLRPADAALFRKCAQEALSARPKYAILNLSAWTGVDPSLEPELLEFQERLREIPCWLLLAGLPPALRESLLAKQLVEPGELQESLQSALQFLVDIGLNERK